MGVLTRVIALCLRLALRRWPADMRADLSRDWAAELAMLEHEPGTAWQRLTFAASLAVGPRAHEREGSSWSPGPALRVCAGLLLAGMFGVGVWTGVQLTLGRVLLDLDGVRDEQTYLWMNMVGAAVGAAVTSGYGVVVGRWLGRYAARRDDRARVRLWAGQAVGCLGVVVWAWLSEGGDLLAARSVAGVVPWAVATFVVVVGATDRLVAGRRRQSLLWTVVGAPSAAVLAATVPLLLPEASDGRIEPYWGLNTACWLLPWTVCAVSFGRSAARTWALGKSMGTTPWDAGGAPEPDAATAHKETGPRQWVAAQSVVTVAAAGAAVLWAVGMVVLQPLSEPDAGSVGENNTYWARELRWDAVVAVVLAVIVCARARPGYIRHALLGGLCWLAVDIGLDRAELSVGTLPLAVAAVGVALVGCLHGIAARGAPNRAVLLVVAAVATVLSGVGLVTESPTDTEPALNPASAAAGCALGLVAIGAALGAAHRLTRNRYGVAAIGTVVAAAAPWLVRDRYPQPTSARLLVALAVVMLLAVCVVAVAWRRPDTPRLWLRYPAVSVATLLVFPLVFLPAVIALMIIQVSDLFTALAGNPPVNAADTDLVIAIPAVLAGLVLGALLVVGEPGRGGARPVSRPPVPDGPSPAPLLWPR